MRRSLRPAPRIRCSAPRCPVWCGIVAAIAWFAPASAGTYVTQSYIDTTVQKALYALGEADDGVHTVTARRAAIDQAKAIASRLRKLAETDANRNYILARVAELEGQIVLEEEALDEEAGQGRTAQLNSLVMEFNREIGRPRPDFGKLKRLEHQARPLGASKADEMANSILQRVANVSGGLVRLIQDQFAAGAFDSARMELAYCRDQREHLWISVAQYGKLEAQVQSGTTVDGEIRFMSAAMSRADSLIARRVLGETWNLIRTVDARLASAKSSIRQQEWDRHHFRNRRIERAAQRLEDSLVNVALNLLKTKGETVALEYSESTLKQTGVSQAGMVKINDAIMSSATASAQTTSPEISAELASLTSESNLFMFSDLRQSAKTRARTWTQAVGRDSSTQGPTSQVDRVRRGNLQTNAERSKERGDAQKEWQAQEAERVVVEVYKLLNQNKKSDARRLFNSKYSLLKVALSEKDLASVDAATGK